MQVVDVQKNIHRHRTAVANKESELAMLLNDTYKRGFCSLQYLNNLTLTLSFFTLGEEIDLHLVSIESVIGVIHIYIYVFTALIAQHISLSRLFHVHGSHNIVGRQHI